MAVTQSAQKPDMEFRSGRISAAVWSNDEQDGDRTYRQYSIRIQKRYQEKDTKEWKSTQYFYVNDLPRLVLVATKAFEYIALKQPDDQEHETQV